MMRGRGWEEEGDGGGGGKRRVMRGGGGRKRRVMRGRGGRGWEEGEGSLLPSRKILQDHRVCVGGGGGGGGVWTTQVCGADMWG